MSTKGFGMLSCRNSPSAGITRRSHPNQNIDHHPKITDEDPAKGFGPKLRIWPHVRFCFRWDRLFSVIGDTDTLQE